MAHVPYTYRASHGTAQPTLCVAPDMGVTCEDTRKQLQGTPAAVPKLGYTHACPAVQRRGTQTPVGFARILAVQVKPRGSNAQPVTIGWLCNEKTGRRIYWPVDLKTGQLRHDGIVGINRRYQKHIDMAYLRHIAGIPAGYNVSLKSLTRFEVSEAMATPASARTRATCRQCAGQRKPTAGKLAYHARTK